MHLSLDDLKKLQQKKYRTQFGCFIAEGEHLLQELVRASAKNPALCAAQVYVSAENILVPDGFVSHKISATQMARISDTKSPQGVFAVVPSAALLKQAPPKAAERVIYLHEIQDPGNLGTILRTLAWFGASRCLLSPGSVDPFNPKVVRASMGAIFNVPIETELTLAQLVARYPRLASLDLHGLSISDSAFAGFDAYVFGNEARGLPQAVLAKAFTIPGGGELESLNLATAVNICVYELHR